MFFEVVDQNYENLPFLLTTVGAQEYQPTMDRPGGLNFHQFLYVTDGQGLFMLGGEQRVLKGGQGVFLRRGYASYYAPTGGRFATAWLTFRGSGADKMLNYFGITNYLFFDVTDKMIEKLTRFEQSVQAKPVSLRSADGYAFVLNLLESLTMPVSSWSKKIRQVNLLLDSRFNEPLTLDALAAAVGTDRYSLCRNYKRLTGITVMSALKNIRVGKAKQMLQNGHMSAQDATILCGFDSPSYFGKIFKAVTGMTPVEYRDSCR